jgi:hypothetical protein
LVKIKAVKGAFLPWTIAWPSPLSILEFTNLESCEEMWPLD